MPEISKEDLKTVLDALQFTTCYASIKEANHERDGHPQLVEHYRDLGNRCYELEKRLSRSVSR